MGTLILPDYHNKEKVSNAVLRQHLRVFVPALKTAYANMAEIEKIAKDELAGIRLIVAPGIKKKLQRITEITAQWTKNPEKNEERENVPSDNTPVTG